MTKGRMWTDKEILDALLGRLRDETARKQLQGITRSYENCTNKIAALLTVWIQELKILEMDEELQGRTDKLVCNVQGVDKYGLVICKSPKNFNAGCFYSLVKRTCPLIKDGVL